MENLFYRLVRYFRYPADTNGKVVEIWQRMRSLTENFQIKVEQLERQIATLENELKGLHSHVENEFHNVHNQLNRADARLETTELYDRLATPWLPKEEKLDDNPEFLLLGHLVNFFPRPVALDVGANEGALSEVLLDAGFEVFAFEPYPPAMEKLARRLATRPGLHLMEMALGSEDTTLALHIAEGGREATGDDPSVYNTFRPHFVGREVAFTSQVEVPVRSLSSLAAKKEIPDDFPVLKIDTEGFDLEVIRGLGKLQPQVVQTEFWGEDFLFVKNEPNNTKLALAKQIIGEMRARGYQWNLLMFRIEGEPAIRFTANLASAPKRSWGNLFFFKDFRVFEEAYRWTRAALPRLQSARFSGTNSTGIRFSILPTPANKSLADSLDHLSLDGNDDVIFLFADGLTEESESLITIDRPVNSHRPTAYSHLAALLGKYRTKEALAVAKSSEGLFAAIAVAEITSMPVALILPNDRAFLSDPQIDPLLAEAIDKTTVAFTTSAALCASVQADLGRRLWFLPAWLQPSGAKTEADAPTNEVILSWIFGAMEDGFPPHAYLEQPGGGAPVALDSNVPYIDPRPPKSLHWSIHPYFHSLHRLAQTGYRPDFVVDVGASTGYWSDVASLVFPKSRFYLIEPLLERYQQRDRSIYTLHPEFITIATAVSDKPGELELNISPDLYSSSFLDGPESSPDRQWERKRVPVRTLDEIGSTLSISGRGLLKIDVQLAEHLVLDGAARFLEQVDVVCLELSLRRFVPTSKTLLDMIKTLHELGFEYFDYAGAWRNTSTGHMLQQDTIFIRSSVGIAAFTGTT
jgi:FkbM family methyltransferase